VLHSDYNKEKDVLESLSRNDTQSFDLLFRDYYPKIERFLTGFLDSGEEAKDLAQEVFVKLWQNRQAMIYVENMNAYLYRSAKNLLYDHIEKSNKFNPSSLSALHEIPEIDKPEEILFAKELNDLINLTIERMPEQRKKIFIMSRQEGLSNKEIAEKLHLSKRTVETHISAALTDIRKVLPLLLLFF